LLNNLQTKKRYTQNRGDEAGRPITTAAHKDGLDWRVSREGISFTKDIPNG
jgi:hypothetical protein